MLETLQCVLYIKSKPEIYRDINRENVNQNWSVCFEHAGMKEWLEFGRTKNAKE